MQTLNQVSYQEDPGRVMYVQNFDDSRGLAIRITYRISLRSSSLWEPRHPLLKVVLGYFLEAWHKVPRSLLFSSFIQIGAGGSGLYRIDPGCV